MHSALRASWLVVSIACVTALLIRAWPRDPGPGASPQNSHDGPRGATSESDPAFAPPSSPPADPATSRLAVVSNPASAIAPSRADELAADIAAFLPADTADAYFLRSELRGPEMHSLFSLVRRSGATAGEILSTRESRDLEPGASRWLLLAAGLAPDLPPDAASLLLDEASASIAGSVESSGFGTAAVIVHVLRRHGCAEELHGLLETLLAKRRDSPGIAALAASCLDGCRDRTIAIPMDRLLALAADGSSGPDLRAAAWRGAGASGDGSAAAEILARFEGGDVGAAAGLAACRGAAAVPLLRDVLSRPIADGRDGALQAAAAAGLLSVATDVAAQTIVEAFADPGFDARRRSLMAKAVASIPHPRCLGDLIVWSAGVDLAGQPIDPELQESAQQALTHVADGIHFADLGKDSREVMLESLRRAFGSLPIDVPEREVVRTYLTDLGEVLD